MTPHNEAKKEDIAKEFQFLNNTVGFKVEGNH